jgi:hypothetical protein
VTVGGPVYRRAIADAIIAEHPGAYWHPKMDDSGNVKEYRVRIPHPAK